MVDLILKTIQQTVTTAGSTLATVAAAQDAAVLSAQNTIIAGYVTPGNAGTQRGSLSIGPTTLISTNQQFQYSTTLTYLTAVTPS